MECSTKVEMLHREGRVLVTSLARHFRTSQITIRKDLEVLDNQGLIQCTHAAHCRPNQGMARSYVAREGRAAPGGEDSHCHGGRENG